MSQNRKAVIAGYAAAFPMGGQAWMILHYLLGLSRLGFDVLFLEDSSNWAYPFNPFTKTYGVDSSVGRQIMNDLFARCGFDGTFVYRSRFEDTSYGATLRELKSFMDEAELLINVSGLLPLEEEYAGPKTKVIIDTDPVFTQISIRDFPKMRKYYEAHDVHFTYGYNLADPFFPTPVPMGSFDWKPLLPPVALDLWPMQTGSGDGLTTIGSWDSKGRDVELNGEVYSWRKSLRFEKIIDLPASYPNERFDLTFSGITNDSDRFAQHGWCVRDANRISRDPFAYRRYIQESKAEFTMAKEQNVRLKSGWFSDRSATYLASGRPIIVEDTGFFRYIPKGQGVFGFNNTDEMHTALASVIDDPHGLKLASRRLAEQLFDAEHVLSQVVQASGITL
ncbi:glycosyltransferase [Desulfovibrio inopinatus]|uniref:glycosyltransferase n=1 Tax=Desulfovibrio inopinatus TaxID=102109 RepID=UPI0003F91D52|nr:hypothetical protein [Desulfovibrio inopinatus]